MTRAALSRTVKCKRGRSTNRGSRGCRETLRIADSLPRGFQIQRLQGPEGERIGSPHEHHKPGQFPAGFFSLKEAHNEREREQNGAAGCQNVDY